MSNQIALSWSRLNVYRECPSQFKSKYVDKSYPDEGDNPAFVKGNRIHKQLEEYVLWKRGECKEPSLCAEAANAKGIIDNYVNLVGAKSVLSEKQIAITHNGFVNTYPRRWLKEILIKLFTDLISQIQQDFIDELENRNG